MYSRYCETTASIYSLSPFYIPKRSPTVTEQPRPVLASQPLATTSLLSVFGVSYSGYFIFHKWHLTSGPLPVALSFSTVLLRVPSGHVSVFYSFSWL
jgi:hypothetical protein